MTPKEKAKQTAVDWLKKLYEERPESIIIDEDFEKAKEMEKEQIETAYNSGQNFIRTKYDDLETGEDYYNLNYGK